MTPSDDDALAAIADAIEQQRLLVESVESLQSTSSQLRRVSRRQRIAVVLLAAIVVVLGVVVIRSNDSVHRSNDSVDRLNQVVDELNRIRIQSTWNSCDSANEFRTYQRNQKTTALAATEAELANATDAQAIVADDIPGVLGIDDPDVRQLVDVLIGSLNSDAAGEVDRLTGEVDRLTLDLEAYTRDFPVRDCGPKPTE